MSLTNINGTICEDGNSNRPLTAGSTNLNLNIKNVVSASATTTPQSITLAQSSSIIFLPQATASIVINLPAITSGFSCEFVITAVPDGTHTITISAPSANMSGVAIGVAAGLVPVSAANITNLIIGATAANAKVGDNIRIWSNGTKYYYYAISSGTASLYSTS